jgi:hypothetical protein
MKKQLLLAALLAFSLSVNAQQWRVETRRDSMTDEVKRTATITNQAGYSVSVYRGPGGAAWFNFALPTRSLGQISPKRAPVYRVDRHEPEDLDDLRRTSERSEALRLYTWEPGWVNAVIWHGDESEGRGASLEQLMNGKSLAVRYYLFTGGHRETTFPLTGAQSAISKALGIAPTARDQAKETQLKLFQSAVIDATTVCMTEPPKAAACLDSVAACSSAANKDLERFLKCVPPRSQ